MQAHWRDTARPAKFFFVDALAVFPFFLFLLHIAWWTFIVATVGTLFFTMLARFGYTIPVFFRLLRCKIAGPHKIAVPDWRR